MRKEWMETDYYAELGVDKDASSKEIKKAFRKLAREFHPDNNPDNDGAETRFKEINEAYDTIGNDDTRQEYDHAREMGYFVGGPGGGQQYVRVEDLLGGNRGAGTQDIFGGFQDLFAGAGQRRPQKGGDASGAITLSFHEAITGATTELSVGGTTVKVKIPKGVSDGTRVKVRGKGGSGVAGGPRGDLYVTVHVGTHPIFGRIGKIDLTIDVPITYTEAALGAVITIPTLQGTTKIKVPPGTQGGTTMKLSGKGIETANKTGNLLVELHIAVPSEISEDETAALETLSEAQDGWNPRSRLGV